MTINGANTPENGRMARALQNLVLSRDGIAEPAFSNIEEWLGHNPDDYL